MRIYVYTGKDSGERPLRLWLWLPNCLVTGELTARLIGSTLAHTPSRALKRHVKMTYDDIRAMQMALKSCRRRRGERMGIEVHSHDGQRVSIRL